MEGYLARQNSGQLTRIVFTEDVKKCLTISDVSHKQTNFPREEPEDMLVVFGEGTAFGGSISMIP